MGEPDLGRLVRESNDLFALAANDGFLTWVSQNWEEVLGWTPAELTHRPFLAFVHPDDQARTVAEALRLADGGGTTSHQFRNRYQHKTGGWRWLEWNVRAVDGVLYCVVRDVTERMRVQAELEERVRALQVAEAMAGVGHWRVDGPGGVFWSPEVFRIHGRDPADGQPSDAEALGYIVPDDQPPAVAAFTAAFAEATPFTFEARIRCPDGTERWIQCRGVPRDLPDGVRRITGVMQDITERKAQEHALRAQVRRAMEASIAKSAFLANTSHEIRTPMTAILGMTELLADTSLSVEQRGWLRTIQSAGESLLGLIDDMLDLARIESGELTLAPEPVDLHDLLCDLVRLHGARARKRDLDVSLAYDLSVRRVWVDPLRLRQVVGNLLGNAIKFTEQGEITVAVGGTVDEGRIAVTLSVTDTGPGIPESARERVFDAFSQVDASTTRRFGGTGLGLAICRSLVRAMGGSIRLDSQLGQGSTFTVALALEPAEARAPTPPRAAERAVGLRVLLVEDNPVSREVLSLMLARLGCRVDAVDGGIAAVRRAADERYDLVLMDVQMPGLDGCGATRRIREDEARTGRARTPVWGLSAAAMVGDRERGLAAGMDDYLAKPIRLGALRSALLTLTG